MFCLFLNGPCPFCLFFFSQRLQTIDHFLKLGVIFLNVILLYTGNLQNYDISVLMLQGWNFERSNQERNIFSTYTACQLLHLLTDKSEILFFKTLSILSSISFQKMIPISSHITHSIL